MEDGGKDMRGLLSGVAIEKVVRELLEVLDRQRDFYRERMIEGLYNLADDPEDVLMDVLRELDKIERSVIRITHTPTLVTALLGSWFFAVLGVSEDLIRELLEEMEIGDIFVRKNGGRGREWKR